MQQQSEKLALASSLAIEHLGIFPSLILLSARPKLSYELREREREEKRKRRKGNNLFSNHAISISTTVKLEPL